MNAKQRRTKERKQLTVLAVDHKTATITVGPAYRLKYERIPPTEQVWPKLSMPNIWQECSEAVTGLRGCLDITQDK